MIYQILKEIIPHKPTIIEIGAHVGTDTIKLYRLLQPSYYLAIEPDERCVEKLRLVCDEHDIDLMQAAVGAKTGTVEFWQSSIPDCNSLKKPMLTHKRPAGVTFERSEVMCTTLDATVFNQDIKHINLIWMDVQGAELEVFAGARHTLTITDFIYTECQTGRYIDQPGLDGILKALPDWQVIVKNGENILLRNKAYNP